MASPLVSDVPGLERWSTVSTFLTALCEALGARMACYLPVPPNGPAARSHPQRAVDDTTLSALDQLVRQWQADLLGQTVRLSAPPLGTVDIAAVRGLTGDPRGALVLVRARSDRTDRSTASAEVELAAALVPSVLGTSVAATARQALVDWAAGQPGGRVAFAVSVDRLGTTNEVLGYPSGDMVLRSLVGRIEYWAGPSGRVAPAGGARYLVIRTDLPSEAAALDEVERLRGLAAEPVTVAGIAVSRSVSVGVCADLERRISADALLWGATRAGAAARAGGGDMVRVYDEADAAGRLSRLALDLELAGALSSGALRIHYQPEFDLVTGAIVAVEALLRWQHPRRGLLSADVFVPESEQTHTFAAVQRWVIETACCQLAQWQAAGLAGDLVLRVNVPAAQAVHGGVTRVLFGALDHYGLAGSRVCLELTERRMPEEVDALAAEISRWRERGVTVAVDDFGTGEGTLSHLQLLPVDVLKIDQRFVAAMRSDPKAHAIVDAVLVLARSLALDVVAEGVTDRELAAALLAKGCRRGQGNGLAEPLPPERLEGLLRAQGVSHVDAG